MENQDNRKRWSDYFKANKKIWFDPSVPWYVKLILRTVELYRSDEQGWNISERKFAQELGIGKETASKGVDFALSKGWLLGKSRERKRRKLSLAAPLRSPGWTHSKSNNWVSDKSSKSTKKINKIIEDFDFKKLIRLDTSEDRGYRQNQALMEALDARYPGWKYKEEWEEAMRFLREVRKEI